MPVLLWVQLDGSACSARPPTALSFVHTITPVCTGFPLRRLFRVVPAAEYLQHFASDRSHMLDEVGAW